MPRRVVRHARNNAVAYLALFVALGGTSAWAAGQITGAQIKDASLTGADVLDDSLTGDDILESSLVPSATNVVERRKIVVNSHGAVVGQVDCATGEKAVGGGFDARGNGAELIPFYSKPYPDGDGVVPTGWQVNIGVPDITYESGIGVVYVICASP